MRHAVLLAAWCGVAFGQVDVPKTLHGIEDRYNNIKTLKVNFTETATSPGGRRPSQSGTLYLRKPGKMLWQYTTPPGKFFLSDKEFTYDYEPNAHRVEKEKLKQGDDPRGPLAFLLGKVDFERDFKQFETKDGAITAIPKTADMPYRLVTFAVAPDYSIKKLSVTQQDGTVIDYTFDGEVKNPPLADSMFKFTAPPGAVVVDAAHADP